MNIPLFYPLAHTAYGEIFDEQKQLFQQGAC